MRRIFLFVVVLLLVIPSAAFAQEATPDATNQAVWNLNQKFTVTDLGFQFSYPEGWVTDSSSGIKLTENQADMNTLLDKDDSTNPKGYAIFLSGVPVTALNMPADSGLNDVVDTLVKTAKFSESQTRVDEPIMAYRSVTLIGKSASNEQSIVTIWLQSGNVIVLSMTGPTVDQNVEYTWGMLLGSITPTNALDLTDTPLQSPNGDFSMNYPVGWTADKGVAAQDKDDFAGMSSNEKPKNGIVVVMLESKLSDIGRDVFDLSSLGNSMHKTEGWDDSVVPSEFIVAGQPALNYTGPVPKDDQAVQVYTLFLKDADNAVIIAVFAPTQDDLTAFMPTYLTMLGTVKPIASSS